ncbi:LLM class F420-dependent oxidoreductase [Jatrophihabitans sp.]|uniref:LLM class F420-dependent oxidoreductase n=1 Tax=Jatrophihabitans sp. TaxID=1932789 RepID=UPI0030C771E9
MKIGVVFPQTEIGADVADVRAYGEGVDSFGFDHLLAYDHVVGADPSVHLGWDGPYDVHTTFQEPFVLFGFLAAITKLELVTGVIILPQRQTALVAKQAAQVDLLTQGRFRLGVGIGWNKVEYDVLGKDFHTRGRRLDEQVSLLRRLWSEESVTVEGTDEPVTGAGLAPLPVQRPIPIWFGGSSPAAYARMGRLADGWFPQVSPGAALDAAVDRVGAAAEAAGRDPADIPMEGRVNWHGSVARLIETVEAWEAAGASHITINTMGAGLGSVHDHLALLAELGDNLDLRRSVR